MNGRRKLLIAGGAAVLFAGAAGAALGQGRRVPRIGFLSHSSLTADRERVEAFRAGLRESGYVEKRTIFVEYRFADGRLERLPGMAQELLKLGVDVILAASTPAIQAARGATQSVPIVMGPNADPVGMGFVASLSRPGGNITGVTSILPELSGKRLELMKEMLPNLRSIVFLANARDPAHKLFVDQTTEAGKRIGLRVTARVIGGPDELEAAFAAIAAEGADAVVVQPIFFAHRARIARLAERYRLPAVSTDRQWAQDGLPMAYGPDTADGYRRAALFVDRILNGARAADLPVEQPSKFELAINLGAAKAIGFVMPPSLVLRADRVIE